MAKPVLHFAYNVTALYGTAPTTPGLVQLVDNRLCFGPFAGGGHPGIAAFDVDAATAPSLTWVSTGALVLRITFLSVVDHSTEVVVVSLRFGSKQ